MYLRKHRREVFSSSPEFMLVCVHVSPPNSDNVPPAPLLDLGPSLRSAKLKLTLNTWKL